MTNKPTWEEQFEQLCSRVEYGDVDTKSGMQAVFPKQLKKEEILDFISTKLAEQRQKIAEKLKDELCVLGCTQDYTEALVNFMNLPYKQPNTVSMENDREYNRTIGEMRAKLALIEYLKQK